MFFLRVIHIPTSILRYAVVILLLLILVDLTGCQDKISSIGSAYFPDTVQFQTSVRNDTGFMRHTTVSQPVVVAGGRTFNLTWASPLIAIGRVADAQEQLESWGLLRFSSITPDTLGHTIGLRLLLRGIPFKYGDTTNSHIDFQVYYENKGSLSKITDSTTLLSKSDLSANAVGTFVGDFLDSTDNLLAIPLDSSIIPQLSATSIAFVVTPGPTMVNVRGFGTSDNADLTSFPELEYTVKYGDSTTIIYRTPVLDFHLVHDGSTTPPHEFTLRGSLGVRDSIYLNLNRPADTAQLTQFSTINNAVLILHLDLNNSRRSNLTADTAGPDIVQLTNLGDSTVFWGNGYHDAADPSLYRFQVRSLIEDWLRNPTQNLGFELRAGYSGRTFITTSVAVEDNTLNRWTFYGPDYPDPTKRPQLILSYSKLH